jgi:hypothetical protein
VKPWRPTVCGLAKAGNKNSDLQFIPDFQKIPDVEQIPNAPAFAKPWLAAVFFVISVLL